MDLLFFFLNRILLVKVVRILILKDGPSSSFFSLVNPSIIDSSDVSIFPPGNPNVPS